MQLKEKIYEAIDRMPKGALALLYEQIKAMEPKKDIFTGKKSGTYTLNQIHEIAENSKSCWADAVIEDRKERL
jgi:hypothetical protein